MILVALGSARFSLLDTPSLYLIEVTCSIKASTIYYSMVVLHNCSTGMDDLAPAPSLTWVVIPFT